LSECDYDGGDCCGDFVQSNYCSACECLTEEVEEVIDPGKRV